MKLKSPPLADELKTLFGTGALGPLRDKELMAQFVQNEDAAASEAAFATTGTIPTLCAYA